MQHRFVPCLVLLLALASPVAAQTRGSGIQLGPDSANYLISKDVAGNRWAISYDLSDGTVTGNVFPTDGGEPQFGWCEEIARTSSPDPATIEVTLRCFGAPPCDRAPCSADAWVPIGEVPVPGSFLLPPGTQSTLSGNVQPILNASCAI